MGWRVVDAQHAFDHAVKNGAKPYIGDGKSMKAPAIIGIGGSLIYFFDKYFDQSVYNDEFNWITNAHPQGVGFYYLDHLTHNVFKGNMDKWFRFMETYSTSKKFGSSTFRESSQDFTVEH